MTLGVGPPLAGAAAVGAGAATLAFADQTFWRKYSASTEQGQERTALLSRLTQRSDVYTLFDSKGTELVL